MDLQDLQDDCRSDFQYGEITEKIIGCAFEVINELGTGFLESVYEKALAIALHDKGFRVQCQLSSLFELVFNGRIACLTILLLANFFHGHRNHVHIATN